MSAFTIIVNPLKGVLEKIIGNTTYAGAAALEISEGIASIGESTTCITPWSRGLMFAGGVCCLTSGTCFVLAICTTTLSPPISYALAGVGHGFKQGGKALNTTATTLGH